MAFLIGGGAGNDSLTGGEGSDNLTGGTGGDSYVLTETVSARDTVTIASGDSAATIAGTGNNGTISGFDTIAAFNVSNTAANKNLLDLPGTVAVAANTNWVDGTNSTLQIGGQTVKSHNLDIGGLVRFDDADNGSTDLSINSLANVAAVVQYLTLNAFGNAGISMYFTASINAVTNTYVYSQTTNSAGGTGGYTLFELVGVNATSLETAASASSNVLYIG